MERRHRGQHDNNCFGCKVQSIQMAPSAFPSRQERSPNIPPAAPNNAWERGVLRDDRGLPIRRNGELIGLHEYATDRRQIDEQVKALKQGQPI